MSHHESMARGADSRMVDRMLFFSDAVFAIVLTLLALDLRPPEGHEAVPTSVSDILLPIGNHLIVFIISFVLVGQWWLIHLRATRQLRDFDWPTAIANLVFLLGITLMPFVTTLLTSNFRSTPNLTVYWGELFFTSASMTVLSLIMTRDRGRLIGGIDKRERLWRATRSVIPGIAFLSGVILALYDHLLLSANCWVAIIPLRIIAGVVYRHTGKPVATDLPPQYAIDAPSVTKEDRD